MNNLTKDTLQYLVRFSTVKDIGHLICTASWLGKLLRDDIFSCEVLKTDRDLEFITIESTFRKYIHLQFVELHAMRFKDNNDNNTTINIAKHPNCIGLTYIDANSRIVIFMTNECRGHYILEFSYSDCIRSYYVKSLMPVADLINVYNLFMLSHRSIFSDYSLAFEISDELNRGPRCEVTPCQFGALVYKNPIIANMVMCKNSL